MIESNQIACFDKIYIVYLGIGIGEVDCGRKDSGIMWFRNCVEICERNRNDAGVGEACFVLGSYLDDIREKAECFEKSLLACMRAEYGKYLLGSYHLSSAYGNALPSRGRKESAGVVTSGR